MNRQKGQALVEFALLVPLLFTMCFAMIYGGMMFMDYLQYIFANISSGLVGGSNISLAAFVAEAGDMDDVFFNGAWLWRPGNDVKVAITLSLSEEANLPKILEAVNFPPKNLKTIEIIMPLEKSTDSE